MNREAAILFFQKSIASLASIFEDGGFLSLPGGYGSERNSKGMIR